MTNLQVANLALAHAGSQKITSLADGTKESDAVNDHIEDSRKSVLRSHYWNIASKHDKLTVTYIAVTGAADNGAGLIRITAVAHGRATGDWVGIRDVNGTTEAVGTWKVTVINANTLDLQGSAFVNAYTSGGKLWHSPSHGFTYYIPLPVDFLRVKDVDDEETDYEIERGFLATDEETVEFTYVYDCTDYTELSRDPLFLETFALFLAWKISFHLTDSLDKRQELQEAYQAMARKAKVTDSKDNPAGELIADVWLDARNGRGRFVRDPLT